jgi:RNA polymerase sigma-B factor
VKQGSPRTRKLRSSCLCRCRTAPPARLAAKVGPISTPSSEQLIRRFLPLADSIARRFSVRWQRVIELDDAVQIARLTLVTKARDVRNPATAPAFLKAHIHGALQHWLRDHSRLVHIPRRAQEACAYAFPFCHSSLDAFSARLRRKT